MVGFTQFSIGIALLVAIAAVVSYAFAWYSWRYAEHPIANRFALLMVADGTWALVYFFQLVSPTDGLALFWKPFEGAAASLAAVFWFLFVVDYTGNSDRVPDIIEPILITESLIYGLLYGLNPGNLATPTRAVADFGAIRLAYVEFGPIIIGEILLTYALLGLSLLMLGSFFIETRNLYRKQAGVILTVTTSVILANAIFLAGFSPHEHLDLTTVFFVVQAAGVGIALYRYDFLEVAPLAASTLLEEMSDPVFVVDDEDRIVDHNDAATQYIEPSEGRLGLDDVEIANFDYVLGRQDGGAVEGGEVTTTRKVGDQTTAVTYDVRTSPIRDQYGEVRGNVVVLRDVTERKAREQALESQNERLEEFAGIVSHDLRNPLTVIDGRIELAIETGNLDHLEQAADSVDRMGTLIEDLLTLAREGRTIDETEPVAIDRLSRAAWDTIDTGDAELVIETEMTVAADPSRLQEALENLFRNAIEHGGKTITVGESNDGFYIADDGPGIPAADRDDVFELGYTTREDGTGFGLAIVQRVVDAHGWSVDVTESDAGGARFEVTDLYQLNT